MAHQSLAPAVRFPFSAKYGGGSTPSHAAYHDSNPNPSDIPACILLAATVFVTAPASFDSLEKDIRVVEHSTQQASQAHVQALQIAIDCNAPLIVRLPVSSVSDTPQVPANVRLLRMPVNISGAADHLPMHTTPWVHRCPPQRPAPSAFLVYDLRGIPRAGVVDTHFDRLDLATGTSNRVPSDIQAAVCLVHRNVGYSRVQDESLQGRNARPPVIFICHFMSCHLDTRGQGQQTCGQEHTVLEEVGPCSRIADSSCLTLFLTQLYGPPI